MDRVLSLEVLHILLDINRKESKGTALLLFYMPGCTYSSWEHCQYKRISNLVCMLKIEILESQII